MPEGRIDRRTVSHGWIYKGETEYGVMLKLRHPAQIRVYNLHDYEGLDLDINDAPIPVDAIIERRKTNIHVAAERRCPGMHIPPHIAYEIDLSICPPFQGDNELGLTFSRPDKSIEGVIMIEALEIDIGWTGHPQAVGYLLPPL
jgi:hypothetical protein